MMKKSIHEMMRSGRSQREAIASSISHARRYKKMAKGGMVEDQSLMHGGMEDMPKEEMGMGGDNESMSEMGSKGPDDGNRDLNELRMDGGYYPAEVANPEEMREAQGFAHALRRKASMAMSPENYAMGGLVQAGPEEDERLHGNHPEDIANHPMSEQPMSDEPMKPSASYPDMQPSGKALSAEAMEAIRMKKKSRRYGMYDPRNG